MYIIYLKHLFGFLFFFSFFIHLISKGLRGKDWILWDWIALASYLLIFLPLGIYILQSLKH
jgi:hypothetical protein